MGSGSTDPQVRPHSRSRSAGHVGHYYLTSSQSMSTLSSMLPYRYLLDGQGNWIFDHENESTPARAPPTDRHLQSWIYQGDNAETNRIDSTDTTAKGGRKRPTSLALIGALGVAAETWETGYEAEVDDDYDDDEDEDDGNGDFDNDNEGDYNNDHTYDHGRHRNNDEGEHDVREYRGPATGNDRGSLVLRVGALEDWRKQADVRLNHVWSELRQGNPSSTRLPQMPAASRPKKRGKDSSANYLRKCIREHISLTFGIGSDGILPPTSEEEQSRVMEDIAAGWMPPQPYPYDWTKTCLAPYNRCIEDAFCQDFWANVEAGSYALRLIPLPYHEEEAFRPVYRSRMDTVRREWTKAQKTPNTGAEKSTKAKRASRNSRMHTWTKLAPEESAPTRKCWIQVAGGSDTKFLTNPGGQNP
ncbi:hypothetical protein C8Q79DRAFT_923146 [Trametes meyenii]|nr:hypothetical protein C8Q79DRAFT_923146 [Trametes meyenii]